MNLARQRVKRQTVRLPDGQLVEITDEDTGVAVVRTRLRDDGQDAIVTPNPIRLDVHTRKVF